MKELIHIGRIVAVKVPEDAENIEINMHWLNYFVEDDCKAIWTTTELPKGNWNILGRALELTDEQKILCVDSHIYKRSSDGSEFTTYLDYGYLKEQGEYLYDIFEVGISYETLLESHQIDNNYVIILNEK